MFNKFNQNKFDKQINKAFNYLNKFKIENEKQFNNRYEKNT